MLACVEEAAAAAGCCRLRTLVSARALAVSQMMGLSELPADVGGTAALHQLSGHAHPRSACRISACKPCDRLQVELALLEDAVRAHSPDVLPRLIALQTTLETCVPALHVPLALVLAAEVQTAP